ncbi:peptidase M50B-like-domain-containing protein [Schizophyllum commune]
MHLHETATRTALIAARSRVVAPPPPSSTADAGAVNPTEDQIVVIYVMISMAVVIFGLWNVPIVRKLLNPLKLFTIGLHELFHIFLTILSGGRILKVTIDPQLGGATIVENGIPGLILPAGYLGSTLMGACFVLAGFDTLVAKIMSFVLAVGLIAPLSLVRDKLTILLTLIYEALLIGFWFIDHASALRWYCLLVGIMNIFYVVWDVADDRFFHKANDSDATQFSLLWPSLSAHVWALLWIFFAMGTLVAFIMIGLIPLKMDSDQMRVEADKFLPT